MESTPSPRLSQVLNGLAALKNARNAQLAGLTALWAVCAAGTVVLVGMLVDAWLKVGPVMRWGVFVLMAAAVLGGAGWAIRTAFRRYTNQSLAALAEGSRPEADNALINAVQLFERGTASPDFIEAILAENPVDPAQVKASTTYSRKWVKPLFYVIPGVALAFAAAFLASPERMRISLARVMKPFAEIPPFTETYITEVTPGNLTVRRGESFTVSAKLSGIVPDEVVVEWLIPASGDHDILRMTSTDGSGSAFACDFPPAYDAVRYRVLANDAVSEWSEVAVDNPPGLETWEIRVTPPSYTGRETYSFKATDEVREILGGSSFLFAGAASRPLCRAVLNCDRKPLVRVADEETAFTTFKVSANAPYAGAFTVFLETPAGLTADLPLPVTVVPDKLPVISLTDTPLVMKVHHGDSVAVTFGAMDDYGLAAVILEQVLEGGPATVVSTLTPGEAERKLFRARFMIDTGSFKQDGNPLKFRLRAVETASDDPRRHGVSPVVTVTFFTEKEMLSEKDRKNRENEETLDKLLVLQKNALKQTNDTMLRCSRGGALDGVLIGDMANRQTEIRTMAIAILRNRDLLGALGDTLAGMVNKEFTEVLTAIDALNRPEAAGPVPQLQKVAVVQTRIVALLTGMNAKGLSSEEQHKEKADIFALIQRLVKDQNVVIRLCLGAQKQEQKDTDFEKLAQYQVNLSKGILAFSDMALKNAEEHAEDDLSAQLRKALAAIDEARSYNYSMAATEALEDEDLKSAVEAQKLALKGLAAAYKILNDWRVNQAHKTVAEATEVLAEVKDALAGMEKIQARIAETAHELQKQNKPEDDPSLKDDMEKMAKEHEKMMDMIEQCANDLYQFPDLPVCNELNTKMREIFEDVMQAKDSENLKNVEIAVQKEDSFLEAIRNTKERIDDVEMWLPDFPDHFVWNMESFDADEFPEMPLVELPEELQDIVGDLLDQDMDMDAASQDTTGNNMAADMEMGWAVMDGPIPTFSAKGKTGNTRPNDNEMTGRSGAGREGQATGELVENHVKGYEGRQTHARRTNDKFQKGQVTEDKDSTLKARSTGGGKLGGDSESIGMFGNAQRRDLHRGAHGTSPRQLRQETDVLFAKARLLYVNPGSLGEAAHHLSGIGKQPPDLKSFDGIKRKVVRRLSDSLVEMREGTVLAMPVDPVIQQETNTAGQRQGENVSEEYKPQLNSYFKSLNQ